MNYTSPLGKCKPWWNHVPHRGRIACHCEHGGSANLSRCKPSPTLSNTLVSSEHRHACMLSHFSCIWLSVTLRTVACQAPLCMGFSRQEYWSGLPCPPPGDLPDPGIEPVSLMSPALAGGFSFFFFLFFFRRVFFTASATREAHIHYSLWVVSCT